ncbi:MAG: lytic transglycosylase domain-containing protein [Bacillota bacterium]
MLRRLRLRRSFWGALALGILAVPAMFGGTAAAPAESSDQLPEPELNPLAMLPPDPADLLTGLLRSHIRLIDDLAPEEYQLLVARAAHRHRVDPRLIAAVITVETRWQAEAVGAAGERGLMQILPSTGAWLARVMGLEEYDLSDPETSVELGTLYLSMLIQEYGSPEQALAVYNGGPRAAKNWESNPYMQKVMAVYNQRPPAPRSAPPAEPAPLEPPLALLAS